MKKLFLALAVMGMSFVFMSCEDQSEEVISDFEDPDIIMTTDEDDVEDDGDI